MQAITIPRDVLLQATFLNRFGGTLQAWAFLANKGLSEDHIFALLINLDGPESDLISNTVLAAR